LQQGRWRRIADLLAAASQGVDSRASIAAVAADLMGVDQLSLTFVSGGVPVSTVGHGPAAVELCRLQFAMEAGPSFEAVRSGVPVLVDDVSEPAYALSAPWLVAALIERHIASVFAFPLTVGDAPVGVMTGHRSSAGPLTEAQHTDGLIVATLAAIGMLQGESGSSAGRVDVMFDPRD
jgi:hypothetical protein